MYNNQDPNKISLVSEPLQRERRGRKVYLDGAQNYYATGTANRIRQVAPAPGQFNHHPKPFLSKPNGLIYETLKPIYVLMRIIGIFPITNVQNGVFKVSIHWMVYSVAMFFIVLGYIGYIRWDKVEIVRSAEGRFEEAVIDYLFTVYLVPIIVNPIVFYEAKKQAKLITDWCSFEKFYGKISQKSVPLYLGNKPLIICIVLFLLSCTTMIVTHATMVHFRALQVVPYCYINTMTYLIGGSWYLQCEVIGKTATEISEEFKMALKHLGPSSRVADYRSLWMMLSKIGQDMGNSHGHTLTFLCLYLFLIITLTIYGLLSQIQEGLGVKDIGLTITAASAIALLFFICDESHYASNCVKAQFQKKLLLVELSWMNDDAQQEINMFLRATEMNPTDISLGGFFDVNRSLFKSLLATMVTYLVVLLQFQISIPDEGGVDSHTNQTTSATTPAA